VKNSNPRTLIVMNSIPATSSVESATLPQPAVDIRKQFAAENRFTTRRELWRRVRYCRFHGLEWSSMTPKREHQQAA